MSRWKPDAAGRLVKAAMTLFDERGYEATTVAEITEAAGLTKRTFFRYFADKREVLFLGSGELQDHWVTAVRNAPPTAGTMEAVQVGLVAVAELFGERHPFARVRARIVAANPELQERELIKLAKLADALAAALRARRVPAPATDPAPDTATAPATAPAAETAAELAAELAAQTGVTIFHSAFGRWVQQDDPEALGRLMDESLAHLRAVVAGH